MGIDRSFRTIFVLLALVGCSLFAGCSSGSGEAEAALNAFYDALNRGDYSEALSMYTEQARADATPDGDTSLFSTWGAVETKNGKLQSVEVDEQTSTENGLELAFQLVFEDGTRARRTVRAAQEGESWRIDMVRALP